MEPRGLRAAVNLNAPTAMKRPRPSTDFLPAAAHFPQPAEQQSEQQPRRQSLQRKSERDTIVLNSPYGTQQQRNGVYGWGDMFRAPRPAWLLHLPNIRIGISSLNAVPNDKDRSMSTLLAQYRQKFSCLEHCYPYHRIDDAAAWATWARMVQDSNSNDAKGASGRASGQIHMRAAEPCVPSAQPSAEQNECSQAGRFLYTIKANKYLTHEKQAAMDADVEAHIDLFFRDRCQLLEPFLGPILLQFPPFFHRSPVNLQRLEKLAGRLPQDEVVYTVNPSASSAERQVARTCRRRRVRIAVEFRHRSWYHAETFALLTKLGWALVVAHHFDEAAFSAHVDTGVDFMYVRLHGSLGKNVGDYGRDHLRVWAERIARFVTEPGDGVQTAHPGGGVNPLKEVFVFLNNSDSHVAGTTSSVVDATCLAEEVAMLLPPPPPATDASTPLTSNKHKGDASRETTTQANERSPSASTVHSMRSRVSDAVAEVAEVLPHSSVTPPPQANCEIVTVATDSILDVDGASSGTIVID